MNEIKSGKKVPPALWSPPNPNKYRSPENRALIFLYEMKILRAIDFLYMRGFIRPENVVTNSKLIYERYHEYYGVYPRTVVYPPIEFERYHNAPPENYYLTVSRLEDIKRIDVQIEAFRNTDIRLKIVGTGEYEPELKKQASDCPNIEFLGRVKDAELVELYARCNAFIFSAYQEDFGLTPLEALASGKPVISTSTGGVWEYLDARNSFRFNTAAELRKLIRTTTGEQYEGMRDACLATAKRFDVKSVAAKLRRIIRMLYEEQNK